MTRPLTLATIKSKGACASQVALFRKMFGKSVDITEAICIEHAAAFSWNWASENLLSKPSSDAYDAAIKAARDAYRAAIKAASDAYDAAIKPASDAYDAAIKAARDAYRAATKPASDA